MQKIFETKEWHQKSLANKELLRDAGDNCGCFGCCKTLSFSDITEYVSDKGGETALCPYCEMDAVIPSNDEVLLNKMFDEWMT
jgi:hypothetical protein